MSLHLNINATFQIELEERKNHMKMQDVQRYNSEQLNDLEEEERRKNEELRMRAFAQIQEQEDEIKQLNEVNPVLKLLVISVRIGGEG